MIQQNVVGILLGDAEFGRPIPINPGNQYVFQFPNQLFAGDIGNMDLIHRLGASSHGGATIVSDSEALTSLGLEHMFGHEP